jgi:uncharacterized protein (DUF2236 family)
MKSDRLLPPHWVDEIFRKLSLIYGRDFLSRWEGQDELDVKAHWSEELGGFREAGHCIKYALENMPDSKAPTVLEFRALCRKAPEAPKLALEAPQGNPGIARAALESVKPAIRKQADLQWAHDLKRREAGQNDHTPSRVRMSSFQRQAWREALGVPIDEKA